MTVLEDPDGVLRDVEYRERRRGFGFTRRPDGSATGRFELTSELAEHRDVVFDALAAPAPEIGGVKDPRTADQRRHDALLDMVKLVERAELLPSVNGVTATVVLHVRDEDWRAGDGPPHQLTPRCSP